MRERAGSALLTLILMGILVLEFGSLEILYLEQFAPGANITTASDALWYTIVTISTVGYGDQYPVTSGGRLMGSLIIVIGVGIFGTFTGYLANAFLAPSKAKANDDDDDAMSRESTSGKSTSGKSTSTKAAAGSVTAESAPPEARLEALKVLLAQPGVGMADVAQLLAGEQPTAQPGRVATTPDVAST